MMTHLPIKEVQSGILKHLKTTVELIYGLQGRRITTFHNNGILKHLKTTVAIINLWSTGKTDYNVS